MLAHSAEETRNDYRYCLQRVRAHYENFPVASVLLPKALRAPIAAIYVFARDADDIADEGHRSAEQRLALLNAMDDKLRSLNEQPQTEPGYIALADTVARFDVPVSLLRDLLVAFKQDVTQTRYATYEELLNYCRHSANPVGRLLLHLTGQSSPQNLHYSDAICSALQIINFLQDIEQDYVENNRIYFPQQEWQRFGISERHFAERICDDSMRNFLQFQRARVKQQILEGAPLGLEIGGRFGLQLRAVINGGLTVLRLLQAQSQQCFSRPRLQKRDWLQILLHAVLRRYTT